MSISKWIAALVLTAMLGVTGNAMAVGYERHVINNKSAPKAADKPLPSPSLYDALSEATFSDTVPNALDKMSSVVKDILMQFGLADREGR